MPDEPLTFLASIAPLQSAIMVGSDGGARFKIDLPETEMPAIVRLMMMRGMLLKITVEAYYGDSESKRRSESGGTC